MFTSGPRFAGRWDLAAAGGGGGMGRGLNDDAATTIATIAATINVVAKTAARKFLNLRLWVRAPPSL